MKLRIKIEDDYDFDRSCSEFGPEIREECAQGLKNEDLDVYQAVVTVSMCDYINCPHHSATDALCGIVDAALQHGEWEHLAHMPQGYMRSVAAELFSRAYEEAKGSV